MVAVSSMTTENDERHEVVDDDDEDEWECAYPDKCLMPSPFHQRSECHTVEDMEAYYRETEGQESNAN